MSDPTPTSDPSRDLLRRLEADPAAATMPDPTVLQAWQAMSGELLRLIDHVDEEIDPVVRILGAIVAGFHGIEPDEDTGMSDLFALGAQQRVRLDRLDEQVQGLIGAVTELKGSGKSGVCPVCQGNAEWQELRSDTRARFQRQAPLRRLSAALLPSEPSDTHA
jgi:hypothetical protein